MFDLRKHALAELDRMRPHLERAATQAEMHRQAIRRATSAEGIAERELAHAVANRPWLFDDMIEREIEPSFVASQTGR